MRTLKKSLVVLILALNATAAFSQVDTVFWFASPWVTPDHTFRDPYRMHFAGAPGTQVRVWQPAAIAPNKYDTTFTLPASGYLAYTFWRDAACTVSNRAYDSLEVRPADAVVPYGLKVLSNATITVVYDVTTRSPTFYNPETYSLKGQNGMGTEFVCPFQNVRFNQNLGDLGGTPAGVNQPKQTISVVATQSNTVIWITPRCAVVGHPANITYSVQLNNAGDAYCCENLVQNTNVAGNNLGGTIVTSSKPVAVTVSDDSVRGVTGCYDLCGDQIVPSDIVGREYIVIGGKMGATEFEGVFVVATENFTQVDINNGTPQAPVMLNKGDTYYFGIPTGTVCYVLATKNVYALHFTGFGCELGEALLPPMDCGGSNNIKFSRNNNQRYFLNVLCQTAITPNFTLNGNPALLIASDFTVVPGTGGFYSAAQKEFSLAQIPVSSNVVSNVLSNNTATNTVFSLGIYNGDVTTGNMYHYMSLFFRKTIVNTTPVAPLCFGSTPTIALSSTISGGATNGYWQVLQGNGANPAYGSIAAYTIAPGDATLDTLIFRVISDKNCRGDSTMKILKVKLHKLPVPVITSTIAPICDNNVTFITLTGSVSNGVGSWSGGNGGAFGVPGSNTTYTPSLADITGGTITLTLTGSSTVGCLPAFTTMTVGFVPHPFAIPGPNTVVCTNSSSMQLNGAIGGTAGATCQWSTALGTGIFNPGITVPTPTYNFSISDLTLTTIVFSLTVIPDFTTGCANDTKTLQVSIIPKPNVNAGADYSVCASQTAIIMNGSISGAATTGSWSTPNGTGAFPPPNAVPVCTYQVGPGDVALGTLTMVLNSDPGTCPTATDELVIYIVSDPVLSVNANTTVCENAAIQLTGSFTPTNISGFWSANPGGGIFFPSNSQLNGQYTPSAQDLAAGTITMTLHSDPNFCGSATKSFTATVVTAPVAAFNTPVLGRCVGAGVTFSNNSIPSVGTSVIWDFGDTTATSIANNPTHTYTRSTDYLVTFTVSGANNCFDTITRRVHIAPNPISNFSVTNACQGSAAIFDDLSQSLAGGGQIISYAWIFGDETPPITPSVTGVGTNTITHTYATPGLFYAALTVTTSLGCYNTSTLSLNISAQPDAEFAVSNNPSVAQEPIYFADFSQPSQNITGWFWEFGDEKVDPTQAPNHSYANAGTYSVVLTVTDFNGCIDKVTHTIEIVTLPQVPTGFTPNGDNMNDLLFVKGGPFEKILFKVYDNWGQLLFETADQLIGWDGKFKGKEQPVGVYVWTLEVDMYNNRKVNKNGDVTLMR
jgi:gliding motility-associated-like protein